MNEISLLDLWQEAIVTTAWVSAPFVAAALVVGLLTSLLQAATQLQENALSFVPKVVATGVALAISGSWVLERLVRYLTTAFESLSNVSGGSGL